MKAYKTVLRYENSNSKYMSINRALKGCVYIWELGVVKNAPGGVQHKDYLFAYPTIQKALSYATENAPNGEVVLLECDVVVVIEEDEKLFCTQIKPIREIPIRRNPKLPHKSFSKIAYGKAPICYVEGNQSPTLTGESYYWTTPSGRTRIEHPNSYGWPMRYHHSTRRISVGRDWAPLEVDTKGLDEIYSNDDH
jgi:hypothetical protein